MVNKNIEETFKKFQVTKIENLKKHKKKWNHRSTI
jgi:hypothetical protein